MKNILHFIILFAAWQSHAQTATKNYVTEITKRTESTTLSANDILVNTYYDGLGRPVQVIDRGSSPDSGKNIVTHIEYEKNIGQIKEYLPFTADGSNYNFINDASTPTKAFYNTSKYQNTINPYSENRKEASPRQRVLETGFPGTDWEIDTAVAENDRHTLRNNYGFNTATEVKRYAVTTTFADGIYKNSVAANGNYPVNTLTKTVVKNENWKTGDAKNNTTEEFKDPRGNVVLKRTYNAGTAHDTYYVYNDKDLLVFVVPPMANGSVAAADLTKWAYQYNYDAKKRLVEKKLPQKDWEYIIYDKADRVVLTGPVYNSFGDGTKGWLLTKYETFGRVAYTGYYAASTFTSAARNTLAQNNFVVESKTASNTTIDGIGVRYTNTGFPTSFKLLSVNYYDDYSYPNAPTAFPTIEGQAVNTAVKGQPTGTWTRTLTTASSTAGMLSYDLYDSKYRVIRSYSQNHLGGYTQVDSKLTFTGVPTKTVTAQKQNSSAAVLTVTDNFTYDNRDRLLIQTQQIGSGTATLIAENTYDELGALKGKKVGNTTAAPLQNLNYVYNIRGWFTGGGGDLFGCSLNYNESFPFYDIIPLYNGNIAMVFWSTKTDDLPRVYDYNYDHLNRLTEAKYLRFGITGGISYGPDGSYFETVSYDKNGNILTLNRTGALENDQPIDLDELTYTYTGNQLQTVTDATNNPDGFNDGNTTGADFVYDTFGNITQDKNKGITGIKYNHLNLPVEIIFTSGKINYIYDAAGTRLSKKAQPTGGTVVTTDYVNGFQYENNVLQFFPHAEGYVKHKGNNQFMYAYQYKDHLGNVRLSYADVDGNGTINPATEILEENNYYPFGLKHKGYNEIANSNRSEAAERYKFNGMEWQPELGLDLYDFGARNYDPSIGRWLNIDPLAENSRRWTPYNYAYNNPIYFVDPDGMQSTVFDAVKDYLTFNNGYYDINISEFGGAADHSGFYPNSQFGKDGTETDYTYNRKTGEIKQYGEKNDQPDRIISVNKKGETKVLVDDIAKGILKDGINFKQNNNVIEVNGTGQPSESQFQDFVADYTKLAGVEVSGYALGINAMTKDISGFLVEAHKDNTSTSSNSARYNENEKIPGGYLRTPIPYVGKSRYAKYHYHSHPDNSLSSRFDQQNSKLKSIPHFIFSKKYNQQYNERGVYKTIYR